MKQWRLIDTKTNTAPLNMAVDEALLNCFDPSSKPVLRVYGWEDSLSFGRFSKIDTHIKKQNLNNISYARRITGGGTLVHGNDISYSIVMPQNFVKEYGVKESYKKICSFLIRFYRRLGLDAKFAAHTDTEVVKSDICLLGNEAYDIIIEDKKMGGNAQRYSKGVLFQHGTIPLGFNEDAFKNIFLNDTGIESSASLFKLGVDKRKEEIKSLLVESFCENFGCEVLRSELNRIEQAGTKELLCKKYSNDNWNIYGKLDS